MFTVLNNVSNAVVNERRLLCQRHLFNTMGDCGERVNIDVSEIRVVVRTREPKFG